MVLSHACQKTTFQEAMRLDVSMNILTIPVMVSWCDGNTRKTPAAQKVWDAKISLSPESEAICVHRCVLFLAWGT